MFGERIEGPELTGRTPREQGVNQETVRLQVNELPPPPPPSYTSCFLILPHIPAASCLLLAVPGSKIALFN